MDTLQKLKSQYAETTTVENLVVPLPDKGWQLLNALNNLVDFPRPELMERALEIAYLADFKEWESK